MQRLNNEYRLLRRLGSGGMGEVWEAARVKGDGIVVPCAIKLLHAEFTGTARERQLFVGEARIATQLDHSRIVKVTDLGTARDGRPYLVMERVDGVNLRHFLDVARRESDAPLDLDLVTYIVGEVLASLAYAHGRTVGSSDAGIIHSDVTPGNILLSSSGEVKLTDFGIARFAAAAPMSQAVGTPRYMSPEQLRGRPCRATDIYGLGVVLHELLEGKRFLDGVGPDQFHARVLNGPPPELSRADVPPWLDDLRRGMISTRAEDRPAATEARAVLIEHCPRYLAAGARLEQGYAELIGRRRSGMTQYVAQDPPVAQTEILPEPKDDEIDQGQASARELAEEEEDQQDQEISPTQVLVAPESAAPTVPPPRPSPYKWVALISGVLALFFMGVTAILLAKVLREPAMDAPETPSPVRAAAGDVAAPADQPAAREAPEPSPDAETSVLAAAIEPEPDPGSPAEPSGPEHEEGRQTQVEAPTPQAETPKPKPKSKPKSKAKPKIGVVFLVETNAEGELKAGRKVIAIKNRSGYAELTPGRYKLSWRPKGSSSWQSQGQVTIEDVDPSRFKVRLDEGKVVETGTL